MADPFERHVGPVEQAFRENRILFAAALGFSAAMSVLALTTSIYMLEVYDRVLTSRSLETLALLSLLAVGGIFVFSRLDSLRMRLLTRIGLRVAEQLSRAVLRAMIATTTLSGRAQIRYGLRDVDTLRNFIGSPSFAGLLDFPFILVFLAVLMALHWAYFLIVVIGGALLGSLALLGRRFTDPVLARSISQSMQAGAFAEDGLRNADVLEGMGMSATFVERWHRQWIAALKTGTEAADRGSRLTALTKSTRFLIQVVLMGTGALLILGYHATGGVMIGATIIGTRALQPIEVLVSTWKSLTATRLAWKRIDELLDKAPQRDQGMSLPAPDGKLEAIRVGYIASASRRVILTNISFQLQPGECLGIIGPSASGKSTLARLLTGAWPCSSGTVRLDAADIYAWPREELARHIGFLPQDVELFDGTVRENIARMDEGDPEAVVRAARKAGAHEMILSLPKGYDTELGDRGHQLSGGQAQRIGIARALYGEPRLLVLDEPSSNLDTAGEDALLQALSRLKQEGVTVVLIAHRPSTLETADKILVLGNGTVQAFGPRAEIFQRFAKGAAVPRPVPAKEASVAAVNERA
jgi:PrtD family type I secretion system ABC transporter